MHWNMSSVDDVGLLEGSIDDDEVGSGVGLPSTKIEDDVELLEGFNDVDEVGSRAVSYTHLTLPTKRIV